ncbi:MAG TPA: SUMF1/EgtB/PvdO family nonheme iron enzyme [Polyangiaceae bacterium]|nr:SUMF1/EgtB/PvdO family nonheme iron enzyme [Polyangiaceae bacterium]
MPEGTFVMGDEFSGPEHSATVASYRLDKYEVTVGRFRRFVDAYVSSAASAPPQGAGKHPLIEGTGWTNGFLPADRATFESWLNCESGLGTWTSTPGANESKPINCVNWYTAFAFCAWDGGRLPTEAEWEHAAAGFEERRYPWGFPFPDCTYANHYVSGYCAGGSGAPVAVGSTIKGNGQWGHADLGGNVAEWTFDLFAEYTTSPCVNCATTVGEILSGRVFRGGSWKHVYGALRSADRLNSAAGAGASFIGFRCARTSP